MSKKISNIGIYDHVVSGGGVRVFTLRLLEALSSAGEGRYKFYLIWPLFDSSGNYLQAPNIPNVVFNRISPRVQDKIVNALVEAIYRATISVSNNPIIHRLTRRLFQKIFIREISYLRKDSAPGLEYLSKFIELNKLDMVYMPYSFLTLPTSRDLSLKVPIVVTYHDLAHEHTNTWGIYTDRLKNESAKWAQIANRFIFSSRYIRREATRLYNIADNKCATVYLSPFEKEASGDKDKYRNKFGECYFLSLGWAAPHKNVHVILRAFLLFKKKHPTSSVSLVIAGPNTNSVQLNEYSDLKLGVDVFLLGYVPDHEIVDLYAGAFGVITASKSEAGFNAMIFDAMMMGVPVICSNIPQFMERIHHNDIALTFDPDSAEELCDAIYEHVKNESARNLRALSAKKYIESRTWRHVGEDYLHIFEDALERRGE